MASYVPIRQRFGSVTALRGRELRVETDPLSSQKIVSISERALKREGRRQKQLPAREFSSGIKSTYDFIRNKMLIKKQILVQREELKHESLAAVVARRDFMTRLPYSASA